MHVPACLCVPIIKLHQLPAYLLAFMHATNLSSIGTCLPEVAHQAYGVFIVTVQDGVGRRVGEQQEWLWSRGKPVFLLARYMSPARWWDTMNSFLAMLSKQLQHELPTVLDKRLKQIDESISE